MVAIDRSWCEALEEQRELERLARDPACARRRRVAGAVRLVAAVAFVLVTYGLVQVVAEFGIGAGVAALWLVPMLLLGVVIAAEKVLVLFAGK